MECGKVIHEGGDSTPMFRLVSVINRGSYVIRREHGSRLFPDAAD